MGHDGRGDVSEKSMCPGDDVGRPRSDTRPRQSQKSKADKKQAERRRQDKTVADGGHSEGEGEPWWWEVK